MFVPAEAARPTHATTPVARSDDAPADLAGALWSALDDFDDAGAQAAPDTPIETLAAAADQLAPDVVVLSSLAPEPLVASRTEIARMASQHTVLLAGPGADAGMAAGVGARLLAGSPLAAAADVSF